MPSGSKKRKASKKKKSPNPNPSSGPPSPGLVPLAHQGNGHVSTEDEGEETFETPRSQPDPVDLPPAKGSSDRVRVERAEPAPVTEESAQFYEARAEKVAPWPADRSEMDEFVPAVAENRKVVDVDGEAKEMNRKDEGFLENPDILVEEVDKIDDGLVESDSDRLAEEKYTDVDNSNVVAEESLIGVVEGVEAVNGDDGSKEMPRVEESSVGITEESLVTVSEKYKDIDNSNIVTKESLIGDGGSKEMPWVEESSVGITEESLVTVGEKNEALVEEIVVVGQEDEAKELAHVDEGLKDAQLDELAEEKYMVTEHRTVVAEEVSQHSEATAENLNKILVGVVDDSFPEKEAEVLAPQKVAEPSARTEIAPRSEVAHGPLVVRRATLWNCCGLLDVFTGSQH